MAKINITNLNRSKRVNLKEVEELSLHALRRLGRRGGGEANIIFVDNSDIKKLNKKYKSSNITTDVLCFSFFEEMPFRNIWEGFKADIYISSDKAFTNSKKYKTDYKSELYIYVIHGILHMCGFKDNTLDSRKKMDKMQEEILARFMERKKR